MEVLVYASLLLVFFAAMYGMFLAGRRYFEVARSSVLVQQAANSAGYTLARELMEADSGTIEFYPNSSDGSAPPGVVFLSARDASGKFQLDPTYGVPLWQKYVGYYLDVDPENPGSSEVMALYRAEFLAGTGFPTINAVAGSGLGITTATLKSGGSNRRIVAHGVRAPTQSDPHGGFDVYVMDGADKSYDDSANLVYIDLELYDATAGVASDVAGQRRINELSTQIRVEVKD